MYGSTYTWINQNYQTVIIIGIIGFVILNLIFPKGKRKIIYWLCSCVSVVVYLVILQYVTFGMRSPMVEQRYISEPFTSYKAVIYEGSTYWLEQIVSNVICFLPLGVFFRQFLGSRAKWYRCMLFSFLVSFSIEWLQLETRRGWFEYDDLINNVTGALVGYVIAAIIDMAVALIRNRKTI